MGALVTKKLTKFDIELTDEEKAEIEAEAKRQITSDLRKRLKKAYLEEILDAHKKEQDPDSNIYEDLLIDLPGHADRIVLDGTVFFHGLSYSMNAHQARTVRDIMWNAWKHEAEIGKANDKFYRQPTPAQKNIVISPHNPKGISLGTF
jgi:hypothetical protein